MRETRRRRGLSQAELARRAGTSQAHISRIERGEVSPTIDTLEDLVWGMGLTIEIDVAELPGWLDDDPGQRASNASLSMAERLAQGIALSRFATKLAAAPKRPMVDER